MSNSAAVWLPGSATYFLQSGYPAFWPAAFWLPGGPTYFRRSRNHAVWSCGCLAIRLPNLLLAVWIFGFLAIRMPELISTIRLHGGLGPWLSGSTAVGCISGGLPIRLSGPCGRLAHAAAWLPGSLTSFRQAGYPQACLISGRMAARQIGFPAD